MPIVQRWISVLAPPAKQRSDPAWWHRRPARRLQAPNYWGGHRLLDKYRFLERACRLRFVWTLGYHSQSSLAVLVTVYPFWLKALHEPLGQILVQQQLR